ncbi:probable chitinase 2 [Halyomorpha halys]|uniref:probable chitinase 2 n=1 Tax=Halyomorpha halys TaxID=286706 RepID=UPI0006D52925|nr:probable chitinase 2 [Halyomorpha halys]XP_014273392.1 probable chitinase 2 [Halyomorpha halys]
MGLFFKLFFCFLAVLLCNVDFIEAKKPTVVCYVAAWASYRGKFNIKDSDAQHCTHVIYAFMRINENTSEIRSADPLLDFEENNGKGQLKELSVLKTRNPNIKILASVGGYLEGTVKFSEVARTSSMKNTFINSLIKFIRDWNLDGIDICWQFPGGRTDDRQNFIKLLKDIKRVFEPEGWILTVHIIAHRHRIYDGYDVKAISQVVDYINLAAVEYHGPWKKTTGIMAPLNSSNENSVTYMVDLIVKRGAIASKILLGLPTYGHAYITKEKIRSDKYLGLTSDEAYASPWTNERGIIAYNEMCINLKNSSGWTEIFDENSSTPIAYKDNIFISFDNKKSLIEKAKLVNSYHLGGIMLWSLDMDDFSGQCHNKKYPMLSAVTDYLISEAENASNQDNTQFSTPDSKKINLNTFESTDDQLNLNSSQPKEGKDTSPNKGGNQVNKVQTVNIITMLISYIFYMMSL